jgi:hypothetical protein
MSSQYFKLKIINVTKNKEESFIRSFNLESSVIDVVNNLLDTENTLVTHVYADDSAVGAETKLYVLKDFGFVDFMYFSIFNIKINY